MILESLKNAVDRLKKVQSLITHHNNVVDLLKKDEQELSQQIIPDLLSEAGLTELKLPTGEKVQIKIVYQARVLSDDFFNYLVETGNEDFIKNEVMVPFQKKQAYEAESLAVHLLELGYPVERKQYVHPQTLKAYVKQAFESGQPVPDSLEVLTFNQTII